MKLYKLIGGLDGNKFEYDVKEFKIIKDEKLMKLKGKNHIMFIKRDSLDKFKIFPIDYPKSCIEIGTLDKSKIDNYKKEMFDKLKLIKIM